jgi:hypothetical protein
VVEETEREGAEEGQGTGERGGLVAHDTAPAPARRGAADDGWPVQEPGEDGRERVVP